MKGRWSAAKAAAALLTGLGTLAAHQDLDSACALARRARLDSIVGTVVGATAEGGR